MSNTGHERRTRERVEAWTLACSILAEDLPRRWAHSQGVGDRALEVGPVVASTSADATLLIQAAIFHDIGYSETAMETGFHALDGARYLRSLGVEDQVVNLVAHHSCAALEAQERGLDKALLEFPSGPPALTDGLIFCDMTVSPDGLPVSVDDRISEILTRYGPDSVVGRFIARAEPELQAAVHRVALQLRHAGMEALAFASLRGDAPASPPT
ncbi:MAG TPA: HDIG domain-containing protein [Acidimicrobiales bacterium]|nr:HDIG domain-containing protein [Acidimicrobiales bacterium]